MHHRAHKATAPSLPGCCKLAPTRTQAGTHTHTHPHTHTPSALLLPSQEFEFDHVFGPGVSQALIFDEAVSPLVRSCADGFNVCILAYGQTGSGKTYTMQGGRGPDAGERRRRWPG